MVQNKFEGDLSELTTRQIEFISEVLERNGFKDAKVTAQKVGEAGDNYIANVKRIVAERNGEIFQMIAKIAQTNDQLRAQSNTEAVFQNEHLIYTEILPKFTELEKREGIPASERLRYAVCYGTLMINKNEFILLEDLQVPGFKIMDRFKSLTDESVKLVLKSFSKFHALSYVLRNKEQEKFNHYKRVLFDNWRQLASMPDIGAYFAMIERDTTELLQEQKYKDAIKGSMTSLPQIIKKLDDCDKDSRFTVIKQGDPWTNNIMFRIEDDRPVECCMIDYQIACTGSPAADLHYMLFNCTDYALRKEHFYEWLDYYHTALDKYLSEFGLKANFVYPRDQLDADMKRHGKMSLALGILLASVLTRQSADAEKLKEFMQTDSNIEEFLERVRVSALDEGTIKLYQTRLTGLIDSLTELGYL